MNFKTLFSIVAFFATTLFLSAQTLPVIALGDSTVCESEDYVVFVELDEALFDTVDFYKIGYLYRWHTQTSYAYQDSPVIPVTSNNTDPLDTLYVIVAINVSHNDKVYFFYSNELKIPVIDCTVSIEQPTIATRTESIFYDLLGRKIDPSRKNGIQIVVEEKIDLDTRKRKTSLKLFR